MSGLVRQDQFAARHADPGAIRLQHCCSGSQITHPHSSHANTDSYPCP